MLRDAYPRPARRRTGARRYPDDLLGMRQREQPPERGKPVTGAKNGMTGERFCREHRGSARVYLSYDTPGIIGVRCLDCKAEYELPNLRDPAPPRRVRNVDRAATTGDYL
jgi:hypothetical protein